MMLQRETNEHQWAKAAAAAARHVEDTLHVSVDLEEWAESGDIPRFLSAKYGFRRATLSGVQMLWLIAEHPVTPAVMRKHLMQLAAVWPGPMAAVFSELPWYHRQRLVQAGLAFVVPGAQVYLPSLGIDLRDRTRAVPQEREHLRPSAQLLLLWLLQMPLDEVHTSTAAAERLGFTRMTASRAISELRGTGAIEVGMTDRTRTFRLAQPPADVWQAMRDRLTDPVARRIPQLDTVDADEAVLAGLSALAEYTNLSGPRIPIIAMRAAEVAAIDGRNFAVADKSPPYGDADESHIEVWSYDPRLLAGGNDAGMAVVDRLSLYLSLRDDPDERVQQALDQMLGEVGW